MEFQIITTTRQETYKYEDETVVINGSFEKEIKTGKLVWLSGTCYSQEQVFICNFMGQDNEGVIKYNISELSSEDLNKMLNILVNVEAAIRSSIVPEESDGTEE